MIRQRIDTIQKHSTAVMNKLKRYERKLAHLRGFVWLKKGVDLLSMLFFANPMITLSVMGAMVVITLSLSLSCALFMRFLG